VSAFEKTYEVGVVNEIICSDNNNSVVSYNSDIETQIVIVGGGVLFGALGETKIRLGRVAVICSYEVNNKRFWDLPAIIILILYRFILSC
jgi:hypothetical protein